MVTHSKIVVWLLCAVCLSGVWACGKKTVEKPGDVEPKDVAPALTIDDPRVVDGVLHLGADGSTVYLHVKTNIADWTCDEITDGEWAGTEPVHDPAVPPTKLEVVQKLKIEVGENTAPSSRSAVVKAMGAGIERTLKVVQAAAGSVLAFESPVYAEAGGKTVVVPVTANVEYTVSMPGDCPWIEDKTVSATELRLRVAENDGAEPRSATIVVAAKDVPDLRRTLVVEQQGNGPAINIDGPGEITLPWDETRLSLTITSNVGYRIEFAEGGWIYPIETRGMTAKTEEFALDRNTGKEARTVVVQVVSQDVSPEIRCEVRVTQAGYEGADRSVFELFSLPTLSVGHAPQSVVIEIRTGKEADEIALGPLPQWIAAAGSPTRTGDMLAYTFTVGENQWPLGRNHMITFAADGKTLTVDILQDGAQVSYQTVDYNSLTGSFSGGGFGALCDFDPATSLMSGQGAWPKEWTFGLRRPARNEFNQIIYYPVPSQSGSGIADYELMACSDASGTWYTVASGSIPPSLFQNEESMRKGCVIAFPTVENARRLTLRVKSSRGGSIFGASELHFAYDYTQKIPASPAIEVFTPSPAVVPSATSDVSVNFSATTPYGIVGAPSWITYDEPHSTSGTLRFAVQANPGPERSATVTLRSTATGIDIAKTFTITQAANANRLSLSSPASGSVDLASGGGSFMVDLSTNLTKNQITAAATAHWIGMAEKSDIAGGVRFRFTAEDNPGGARNGTITFSGGGLVLDLAVNQVAAAGLVPVFSLQSPASGNVSLSAYPGDFQVVLSTNMEPADITVGPFPEWITAATPLHGNGTVTWHFSVAANPGQARNAALTFSVDGLPEVRVTVVQSESALPGIPVSPLDAIYYDRSYNSRDAYETIDGDKTVHFTIHATAIWAYEFRFPYGTDLVALIYYPRDSATDHGTMKALEVRVICHEEGVPIESHFVDIPPSLYATPASRQAGYLITLPITARNVSHLRIIPTNGYQQNYSVGEIQFFEPK